MKQLLEAIYETVNDVHIDDERKVKLIKLMFEVAVENHSDQKVN